MAKFNKNQQKSQNQTKVKLGDFTVDFNKKKDNINPFFILEKLSEIRNDQSLTKEEINFKLKELTRSYLR